MLKNTPISIIKSYIELAPVVDFCGFLLTLVDQNPSSNMRCASARIPPIPIQEWRPEKLF